MRRGGSIVLLLVAFSLTIVPVASAAIPDLGVWPTHRSSVADAAPDAPALVGVAALPAITDAATTVNVVVDPVPPVTPGAPALTRALVEYCYESAGAATVDGATTVRVKAHLEHWSDAVGASVSPSEFTVDPVPPAAPAAWTCAPARSVNVTVDPWYPFRDEVAIVITATADANAPFTGSEGTDVLRVEYARTADGDARVESALGPARVPDVVGGTATEFGVVGVAAFGLLILAAAGGVFLTRRE